MRNNNKIYIEYLVYRLIEKKEGRSISIDRKNELLRVMAINTYYKDGIDSVYAWISKGAFDNDQFEKNLTTQYVEIYNTYKLLISIDDLKKYLSIQKNFTLPFK